MSELQSHVRSSIVAVYADHEAAERMVRQLHEAGISMSDLSIIGRGSQTTEEPVGFVSAGDYAQAGAATGAWFGGLLGCASARHFWSCQGSARSWSPVRSRPPCWQESKGRLRGRHWAAWPVRSSAGVCPKRKRSSTRRTSKGAKFLVVVRGEPEVIARAQGLFADPRVRQLRPLRSPSALKSVRAVDVQL